MSEDEFVEAGKTFIKIWGPHIPSERLQEFVHGVLDLLRVGMNRGQQGVVQMMVKTFAEKSL